MPDAQLDLDTVRLLRHRDYCSAGSRHIRQSGGESFPSLNSSITAKPWRS
jgi:hypothetical protein